MPVAQRPGHRDALLLAARERGGEVLDPVAQPDVLERGPGHGVGVRPARDVGPEAHVLERREAGEQVEGLEDEGDGVPPDLGELAPGHPLERLPGDRDPALRRRVERADEVEERRLAAARGAEDDDELAGTDAEVDVDERLDHAAPDGIAPRNVVEGDDGGRGRRGPVGRRGFGGRAYARVGYGGREHCSPRGSHLGALR